MNDEAQERLEELGINVFDEPTDALRKRSGISVATVESTLFVNLAGETVQRQYDSAPGVVDVLTLIAEEA